MSDQLPTWLPEEYADLLAPGVAEGVLESLRWKPDQQIINPFGEHVWLKQVTREECERDFREAGLDPAKAHAYITYCCYVGDECDRHKPLSDTRQENAQ